MKKKINEYIKCSDKQQLNAEEYFEIILQ